ncbi:signal transduction histidine kinase [Hymenobacter luteus]|uniref:histidine kinase n=2 Tax=Hymenobacter TaxID=89966 RepID=A0A7W9WA15_9BACT|nr:MULTISPECIES: ATP-binding protein [Hymenobacter]MBB4599422.1 signal transduction histidine kinase [Hymenobacter latericoloratus]MBB6058269.1 signal transduction histidine kinase [Hymenobacter luteus]
MPTSSVTPDELARVAVFADLPAPTLQWLADHGARRIFAPDETIVQPGDEAEYMMALLRGGIQFYGQRNGQREPGFRVEAGQVTGVLPYSRLRVMQRQGVALGETEAFMLHRNQFPELEQVSPELVQRLVGLMSDRARLEARTQERDEKLRALGKLSAGLAHELNNPAAAIMRAAENLATLLHAKPALLLEFVRHCPSPETLQALADLATGPVAATPPTQSALARADAEDELADWLETQGIADGYQLAGGLLDAGLTLNRLEPVVADLPEAARPAALSWLEGQLTTRRLVLDVQEAGSRITTLVANVKTYSHMDRGSNFAPLDVHDGLESTLNIMSYCLREEKITLTRDYAPTLPPVSGQVSSLNQVWTNLLDNAIDALPPGGQITVRTRLEGEFVRVFIIDDGPGIPPEVLPHIMEPFYTTKPAGEGTGLGLDIALRIVEQHGGRLEVQSEPGRTEFGVWLPVMGRS